ncbi:ethanolamine utilization protein, partial [Enterococcus faecalis]
MNVSEMENLIQQITDRICQQLLSSSYSVALA